jgi:hypothetical protein
MLSIASLAAFSSGAIGPLQPTLVRAPGSSAPNASPSPTQAQPPPTLANGGGSAEPTRLLPRGSLLDLSV